MLKWIQENIPDWKDAVVVSPDAGGAKRCVEWEERRSENRKEGNGINVVWLLIGCNLFCGRNCIYKFFSQVAKKLMC